MYTFFQDEENRKDFSRGVSAFAGMAATQGFLRKVLPTLTGVTTSKPINIALPVLVSTLIQIKDGLDSPSSILKSSAITLFSYTVGLGLKYFLDIDQTYACLLAAVILKYGPDLLIQNNDAPAPIRRAPSNRR